jgi:hypothetical protein
VTREKFPLSSMISSKKTPNYLWRCAENHTLDQCRILILSADKYADGLFGFCVIQRVYIYIKKCGNTTEEVSESCHVKVCRFQILAHTA